MNSSNNPRPLRLGRILHNVRREGACPSTPPQKQPLPSPDSAAAKPVTAEDGSVAADKAYQQGRADGRAEALRELSQTVQVLRNAAQVYEKEKARLTQEADEQSITLALAIARKMLGREIRDGEAVRQVLRRALTQAPVRQALRARLHPDDLRAIESTRDQLRESGEPLPEDLVLCADPSISRGGCVLESPAGSVDARVETQLELIEQALRGLEPQGIDDGPTDGTFGPGPEA